MFYDSIYILKKLYTFSKSYQKNVESARECYASIPNRSFGIRSRYDDRCVYKYYDDDARTKRVLSMMAI